MADGMSELAKALMSDDPQAQTAPVKVLLVDDLPENLLSLEALLAREGIQCLKARSGEEALELLLQHEVALALLDVQMPGMDGFQLAEFMRGNARASQIPIIFVTAGAAGNQRRFRGYEAGAVDFIQKPIEPDVLRSKVGVFCDLYRQRRQIAAQRDELEALAEALRTADRHKNQFLAMLGHELRNPVMALGAGLQLLKRRQEPETGELIRDRMDRQLVHLGRLVEDLLNISRISQGKISLRKERIELGDIVRGAIEASQPQIDMGGHSFTTALALVPIWLDADPTRLTQVVGNLLNNAAKYTPHGGRIVLATRLSDDHQCVEIEVTDNGVGIPANLQSQIFEIFTQAPTNTAKAQDGLGIGLALVKQLVGMHEGTIAVNSAGEGLGSSFVVRLPVAEAA